MDSSSIVKSPTLLFLVRFGLFVLLLTPLIFSSYFYQPYVAPKWLFIVAIVELTFFLYVWLIAFHREWRPHFGIIAKTFFLYLAILILSSVFGIDFSTSFWGSAERDVNLLIWLHLGLAFLMLISVFRTRRDWEVFATVSISVAVILSLLHFLSNVGVELLVNSKNGATLGNSSFFGTYLLFQLFFCAFLFRSLRKNVQRFGIIGFVILLLALFTSTAIAATLSFFGGLIIFSSLALIYYGGKKKWKFFGISLLGISILSFLISFGIALFPQSSLREFISLQTSPARFVLWDIAWDGFTERPFFGWGMENFRYVFQKFYHPCFGSTSCGHEIWFDRAHNQFLDVLIQTGLVGLISWLSIFVAVCMTLWKSIADNQSSRFVCLSIVSLLAAYFAQNLTVFDTATSLLFFVSILALASSFENQNERRERSAPPTFFLPIITTLAIPVCFFFFFVQPVRAYLATAEVTVKTKISDRISVYEKAVTLSRAGEDFRRSFLAAQTATVIWDVQAEQRIRGRTWFERELDLARQGLVSTLKRTPNYLRSYLDLGFIEMTAARYYDKTRYKNAEVVLQQAIEVNQQNPLPYWGFVMILLDQDKVDEALPFAETAFRLNPEIPEAHVRRLVVYLFTKNVTQIEEKIQESLDVFPSLESIIDVLRSQDPSAKKSELLIQFYYDTDPLATAIFQ